MPGGPYRNTEYQKGTQPITAQSSQLEGSGSAPRESEWVDLFQLAMSSALGGRRNAPLRAEATRGMQQTHGNRAVQRSLGFRPTPVQRSPEGEYSANNPPMPFAGSPFGLPDFRDLLKKGHDMFGGGIGY